MRFFRNVFSKKSEEIIEYLSGWEVRLDGHEHCMSFIETQLTTKEVAENSFSHIKLTYDKNNLLSEAFVKDQDGNHEELVISNFKHQKNRINLLYNFIEDAEGENYLGGSIPEGFQIPENNCPSSFQYLGKISNKSKGFNWLPHDIDLICPIYMDLDKIWLDYSVPNAPQILNLHEVNALTTAYDDLEEDSFIEFQKVHFSVEECTEYAYGLGRSGIPNWIQYSDIPRCPKTNRTMRFLCQLSGGVEVQNTNIQTKSQSYQQYFNSLNFWGDGDLYVFFEPETKIACYMIQNT